jgi:hypothetical protein
LPQFFDQGIIVLLCDELGLDKSATVSDDHCIVERFQVHNHLKVLLRSYIEGPDEFFSDFFWSV